jgi:hypothetical protein
MVRSHLPWDCPGSPQGILEPGPVLLGAALGASTGLAVVAMFVGAPVPGPLLGLPVGLGVLELLWQRGLRPRVAWNAWGAALIGPFGRQRTVRWSQVRLVCVCAGTVRVHTRDREVISFGFTHASPARRLDRGRLVRASIRLARRSRADRRPPVLTPPRRPWWAYAVLVAAVLASWLAVGPGM